MENTKLEYKTQDALAVAFSAYKINNGYIKIFIKIYIKKLFYNKEKNIIIFF